MAFQKRADGGPLLLLFGSTLKIDVRVELECMVDINEINQVSSIMQFLAHRIRISEI